MDKERLLDLLVSLGFLIACWLVVNGHLKARSAGFANFFATRRRLLNILLLVAFLAIIAGYALTKPVAP